MQLKSDPLAGTAAMLIRISPIIPCADVDSLLTFCTNGLGFERVWAWGDPPTDGAARRDDVSLQFVRDPTLAESSRGAEAMVFVRDVDRLHSELRERGAPIISNLESKPWGVREFTVELPSGYLIRFAEGIEDAP